MRNARTRPGRPIAAAMGIALLSTWGCDGADAVPSDPAAPAPIRLAELLDKASIESPLTGITGATRLDELTDIPTKTLFAEGFERPDMKAAGWILSDRAAIKRTGDRRALQLRAFRWGEAYFWVVPVQPGRHHVFERSIKTSRPLAADFAVFELARRRGQRGQLNTWKLFDKSFVSGRGLVLKAHWPRRPEPDGSWQRGSVSFFTTPDTLAVAIVMRGTAMGDADPLAMPQGLGKTSDNDVWFDDVRLDRLEPTPEQSIALLKARAAAEGADPNRGIYKRGQFLPLRRVGKQRMPWDDNFSYRYALYAPPPTELGFALEPPPRASLRFSVCLSRETRPGDAARFEVLLRADGKEQSLWNKTIAAVEEQWLWHEASVELGDFAGRAVEIVLRTRAEQGHPHPMWGNPVIDPPLREGGPRNVILIAVDTLRADRLSCYGYGKKTSPHLDALAADGVRFDNAASNANWTCPSFASIFTGVVPSRHGVLGFGTATPLPASFATLAERFRARGWATNAIIYKAPLYDAGFDQGFDTSFNVPRPDARADDTLEEAMQWLKASGGRRNFLFLHFDDPHQPFGQPAPFDRAFGGDPAAHGIRLPYMLRGMRDEAKRNVMRGLYDGEVAYVDDRIGAFLGALKSAGIYDDAAIAFVSDHGEELWEHGKFGHGGAKLFDELVRVPLIVKPPRGAFARGKVVTTQVSGFDIMPTLLELAELPRGDDLDAASLVPLLTPGADPPDRVAVMESAGFTVGLRNRRWKYLMSHGASEPVEDLFDLREDPGETKDVASENPEALAALRLQLLDYLLLHKPGAHLVAIVDPTAEPRDEIVVGGLRSAISLSGGHQRNRASVRLTRSTPGPLLAVCSYEADGPVSVAEATLPVHDPVRYRAGDLARLVGAGQPGIYLFTGAPPAAWQGGEQQTVDIRQLEALRALGYTGGEGTGGGEKRR